MTCTLNTWKYMEMNMNVFQEVVPFEDLEKQKAGFSIDIPSLLIFQVAAPQ